MPAIKTRLLALLLLIAALDASALTLGRMRGAALLGQGLDVSVQVQPDADESLANLCVEVDVFHADARQDPGRVQVTFEPAAAGQPVNVRILSSTAIDEPVVTVYLRAGCAQKTSRRYVLLADIASEPAVPVPARAAQLPLLAPGPTVAGPAASVAVAEPATAGRTAESGVAAVPTRGKSATRPAPATAVRQRVAAPKPVAVKSAKVSPPAPAVATEKLPPGRTAGQSRLKLAPLEVLSERVATLESSTANAPTEQAAREAREAQRLQTLESSVKSLVALAAKNEASLLDMRARVQQAEAERYSNPLVLGLSGLLLACLAAIVFLLVRRQKREGETAQNWWASDEPEQAPAGPAVAVAATSGASGFSKTSAPAVLAAPDSAPALIEAGLPVGPRSRPAPITQVDVSLVEMSESTFDRLMQSGATHSAVRKPRGPQVVGAAMASPNRRLVNADELFDIRQQADFFVSLGQTDQAVRILENRISENGEASPLAYLDLLKIFHALGLKADFRQVREDFNLLFNAKVPDFAAYGDEGRGAEGYPEALAEVEAVWGTPQAPDCIETMLFRDQWSTAREVFDLAAFKDFLLLHAVAQSAAVLPDEMLSAPPSGVGRAMPANQFGPTVPGSGLVSSRPSGVGGLPSGLRLPALDGAVDIDLSDPLVPHLAEPEMLELPSDLANLIDFNSPASGNKPGTAGSK